MATRLSSGAMQSALAKWNVKVVTLSGYATRTRPGVFEPNGIMLHHTGSSDSATSAAEELVLVNGRSDLPGPLCQLAIRDDGTVVLVAAGRANHAGRGSGTTLAKVVSENYAGELKPGSDDTDGNAHFYGCEIEYSGSKPPTKAAYDAAVLMCAAICDAHGWTAQSVSSHREWTRRKVDPGKVDMAAFRKDVAAALKKGPEKAPKPPEKEEELDVALTAKDIANAVWEADIVPHNKPGAPVNSSDPVDPDNPNWRTRSVIEEIENRVRVIEGKIDALIAALSNDGK
jgi:hypothetical protein